MALALTSISAADSPQVLPVAVVGADGLPLVGVDVQANLLAPSDGESLQSIPLGSTTSDGSGLAEISVVEDETWSTAIPPELTAVSVEFSGPEGLLYEVLYTPPDRSASGTWELDPGNGFDGFVEDHDAAVASTSSTLEAGVADEQAAAGPHLRQTPAGPAPVLATAIAPDDSTVGAGAATNPYAWCVARDSQSYVSWRPTSDLIRRRIPIQRIKTLHRSRLEYQWETTRRTTLEVMTTARSGSHAAGGMSYSLDQSGSTGVVHRLGNVKHVIVKAEWQYRRYRAMCVRPESTTPFADSGWRKWRPRRYTGGSFRYSPPTPAFTCNRADHATSHAAEVTWTQSTRGTTWKGWFEISGVGLRSTQRLSSVERLGMLRDGGEPSPWSCGSNDFFVRASQGREITPP